MIQPAIITCAVWLGTPLSMTSTILAISMMDWINWPLHMLPHFLNEVKESARSMTRIQKFYLLDETQAGMVTTKEPAHEASSIEIKGNFSWGFINKQEDADSDEENEKEGGIFAKCCGKKKDDEDDSKDKKKSNIDELKDATVGSKMTLKNLDVNIK